MMEGAGPRFAASLFAARPEPLHLCVLTGPVWLRPRVGAGLRMAKRRRAMSEDERVANARSAAAGERESARPSKGASADAGAPSAGDGKVEAKRAKEPMS